jgi:hypothetical protein
VVGEAVASAYRNGTFGNTPLDQNSPDYEARVEYGVKVAKVVTALCVGYAGGDIDAAVCAAENAARYNSMMRFARLPMPPLPGQRPQSPEAREAQRAQEYAQGAACREQDAQREGSPDNRSASNDYSFMNMPSFHEDCPVPYASAEAPFGNGQNTSSCLYRDPSSHGHVGGQVRGGAAISPAITLLPEAGRPKILATPVHRPDSLVLTTPIHRPDPLILITPVLEPIPPLPGLTYPDVPNISILYMAKPEVRSVKSALEAMRSGGHATRPSQGTISYAKANGASQEKKGTKGHVGHSGPVKAPTTLEGIPEAKLVDRKTHRKRWECKKYIYEWDSLHGTVEKYNKNGKHLGEYCPKSGQNLKPAVPGRKTQK